MELGDFINHVHPSKMAATRRLQKVGTITIHHVRLLLVVNLYQELGDIRKANPKYFRNIAVDDSNILYWQGLIVPVSTQPLFFVCVKDLCVC